jgi:ribosomal protein S18 acetylase RimI-like enzyme
MKINLQRVKSLVGLEKIRDLYVSSFPASERREFHELVDMLDLLECSVCLIKIPTGKVAGFCIVWDFKSFAFLEHFAIENDLRGLGIGEGVLSVLREKYKTILLETEHPVNEINQRRINFYQRNGFRLLDMKYVQPSYGKNKPEVELHLMSTSVDFSVETLDECIHLIRERVYRKIF